MLLEDVQNKLVEIEESLGDVEVTIPQLNAFYLEVLTAIATGQCKDAPPEDFAAEAIRGKEVMRSYDGDE
jgi:hypothetical protein